MLHTSFWAMKETMACMLVSISGSYAMLCYAMLCLCFLHNLLLYIRGTAYGQVRPRSRSMSMLSIRIYQACGGQCSSTALLQTRSQCQLGHALRSFCPPPIRP